MSGAYTNDNLEMPVTECIRRDFVTLRAEQTVAEALSQLRGQSLGERIVYFYVVDASDKLVGVVPTRRLLMANPDARMNSIMYSRVVSLPSSATLLIACELFVMHRLLAFPVVDQENRLIGVLDANWFSEEMFDLSERNRADDVFQLMGIRLAMSRRTNPWTAFRKRFPWLLCNISGGIACAFLAGRYEAFLDSVVVLALFIPVVLALAESVSMQSVSLTVQAMHQQTVDRRFLFSALGRELFTAMLLGAAAGLTVGIITYLWKSDEVVSVAVGLTVFASVVTACLLGVVLPMGVRLFQGDPRIAAGPIVLALADMATIVFYFQLAGLLLGTSGSQDN